MIHRHEHAIGRPAAVPPTLFKFLLSHRRRFSKGVGLALLRCLVIAPCPWLFKIIIDDHVQTGDVAGIFRISLIFTGLLLLHYAFAVQGANEIANQMTKLLFDLRGEIFNKLHFLNFGYLDRQKSGRLLSKYAFDTQKIDGTIMTLLNQVLPNTLYSVSIILILITLHWQLSIALLMMIPLLAAMRKIFEQRMKRTNEASRLAQEQLTGSASEAISALRLVRSLGQEKHVTRAIDERSHRVAESRLDVAMLSSSFGTFSYVTSQFLSLLTVAGGAYFVVQGSISIGTLLAFMAGLPIIMMPIHLLAATGEQYFIGQEAWRSIRELLDCEYVENWNGRQQPASINGAIRFDRVTFSYPGAEQAVFKDFSLDIRAGEHIALVGQSGAGKSTLTYLILGLYKVSRGEILIDNLPQSQLDMRWLRGQCAVVLQESLLLSGTVAENIRFAKPEATDEEVRHAARLANAEEFIQRMPEGYDTIVGERGAMLSGGQRQRISIARAILRNPRILILDEATSALDYESERLIQEALERLAAGRTVITIAHRLSTVRKADRVIVLQNGRMLEEGSFETLSARGGYFSELLNAQGLSINGELVG